MGACRVKVRFCGYVSTDLVNPSFLPQTVGYLSFSPTLPHLPQFLPAFHLPLSTFSVLLVTAESTGGPWLCVTDWSVGKSWSQFHCNTFISSCSHHRHSPLISPPDFSRVEVHCKNQFLHLHTCQNRMKCHSGFFVFCFLLFVFLELKHL